MKNESIRKVINVEKHNYSPVWTFKQEDDGVLKLELFKGSIPLDLTGQTIKLGVIRANKTLVELEDQSCFKINNNELDITLKNNILSAAGIAECDLELIDKDGKMTTASFFININKKTIGSNSIQASNEISSLEKLKNDFKSDVEDMKEEYNSWKDTVLAENNVAKLQNEINGLGSQFEDIITKNTEFKEQMKTDFGNAKTDYFGEEHLNVVDRLNSDFDNVHQRINDSSYLEYSGSSIKADNTYYGLTKELSLNGRTLHNLNSAKVKRNFNLQNDDFTEQNIYKPFGDFIKANTKYTVILSIKNVVNTPQIVITLGTTNKIVNTILDVSSTGVYVNTITSPSEVDSNSNNIRIQLKDIQANNGATIDYCIILEGDYTNVDFPINYFEGITSVGESEISEEGKYKISGKSCGKNLFNGEFDLKGGIDPSTGLEYEHDGGIRSRFIPINNKENYVLSNVSGKGWSFASYYDVNKNFIGRTSASLQTTMTFIKSKNDVTDSTYRGYYLPENCYYIRFTTYRNINVDNTVTVDDLLADSNLVQLEEGTVATEYEPYQESNFELLLDESLRSLPNGVCDEITEDGEEIRRVGKVVLDGNRDWKTTLNLDGLTYRYSYEFNFKTSDNQNNINNIFCNNLVTRNFPDIYNNGKKGITTWWSDDYINKKIVVCLSNDYSLEQFKQWLNDNPITVYYELAEPVVTKHNKNINLKTFAGTTHITSDNYLPPTLSCKIPSNVQAIVTSLMEENEELNNTISVMSLENEEKNLENIETNLDQDVRLTMLELGVI